MAGDLVGLTLMHGSSKHKIEISAGQEGCEPTLQDMATVIAQVTGVPQQLQKLIFKGKSLKEMEQPLSVLGVKNGCKIMMIGKKNSPEEEAELKKLKELEKSTDQLSHKLEEINAELTGIQNSLPDDFSDCRHRRKGLVKNVQTYLAQCDVIETHISQEREKLQSKNLALAD
ncbi:BAG family molecular chaperone regulator 1 isoform X2 [Carcharodon carcharias]|uniref:BAG family molecular chaperone regulator 1 isoform X2 n=1 Tax=Carcharodon carcharias TaxID=13397 RepID=UPI001B7F5FF5|nr:BAG family molecular chaperone regulator 1 isoform X2 [Carcharodon carcharias]